MTLPSFARPNLLGLGATLLALTASALHATPLPHNVPVRAWSILSDSEKGAQEVIAAAPAYGINQIQLSQRLNNRLKDLRDPALNKLPLYNKCIDWAHAAGIQEVVGWDDMIYSIEYYPAKFRTGPNGTIDLDNPEFWTWLQNDYRELFKLCPKLDGVVLQFMESGGNVINQYSKLHPTDAEKLALLVRKMYEVVVQERHMNLYTRIYPNDRPDNPHIGEMVDMFPADVRLLIKITPLDYLLTAPNCALIGLLNRDTVVEFVPPAEFAGQGVTANTWVEDHVQRWRQLARKPHVVGYSARTDRFLESRIVGKPGEIDLYALKRATEDENVTAEQIYDEFITAHYGAAAVPEVKAAMKNAFDIATCTFYTLGTILGNHGHLEFETYTPPYIEMCSGRWYDPSIANVRHGVNREFHYWRDVMNHITPAFVKDPAYQLDTIRSVELHAAAFGLHKPVNETHSYTPTDAMSMKARWLKPGEGMDEEYLRYIVTEKNFGVQLAEDSVHHIEQAKGVLKPADYDQLYHYFNRTLLTARLWRATTSAYFGFRTWCRGPEYQTPYVHDTVQHGLAELKQVAEEMRSYPVMPPTAMYDWAGEAKLAEGYFKLIVEDGWPKDYQNGIANPNGGMKFPYQP